MTPMKPPALLLLVLLLTSCATAANRRDLYRPRSCFGCNSTYEASTSTTTTVRRTEVDGKDMPAYRY